MKPAARRGLAPTATAGFCLLFATALCSAATADRTYGLTFELRLAPDQPHAAASIQLIQADALLREVRLNAPRPRYGEFRGDGVVTREGDTVTWLPPANGGRIEYSVIIDHQRENGGYDALVSESLAVFRVDDVFPAAWTRLLAGARSRSKLRLVLPSGWSATTPYPRDTHGDYTIDNPARSFDRPTGWVIAGHLGRRQDLISGINVSVTAPVGAGVERIAMLAMLRWTLPRLSRELDAVPSRLSVVVAGDPMWRGGLSAPNSVFVHADRPLLSENGTSTLLHEVVHMMMPVTTVHEHDWIDEGIAEYVTLRLLRDSGTISNARFVSAIAAFDRRGLPATELVTTHASGAVKARAVTIFHALDDELIEATDGNADIFTLLRRLCAAKNPVDSSQLHAAAVEISGRAELESLAMVMVTPARSGGK